ncbi:hypothetical protein [Thalassobacillus sp. B23F22_16]|uniref:hypothetical protein n=1 Tax=Thalassobacillus sp. B23F22_16 TaxID=3459513 RepID=UPI00374A3B0D
MTKKKMERIELRYDPEKDKDMLDFIDNNGSTRAGFIKHVLKMYKNQMETMIKMPDDSQKAAESNNEEEKNSFGKRRRKPSNLGNASFSSKDFE